jgi:subtilisin family serine protease
MNSSLTILRHAVVLMFLAAVVDSVPALGEPRVSEETAAVPASTLFVVTIEPGGVGEVQDALARTGALVIARIEPHRWLVSGRSEELEMPETVIAVDPWHPVQAIGSELRDIAVGKRSDARERGIVVALAPGADLGGVQDRLETVGASITWVDAEAEPAPQIGLRAPGDRMAEIVDALAATQGLAWAELQAPIRLLNHASVWACQSGEPGSFPVFDHGLRGEGQIIGIMDTGLDIDDCRFEDEAAGLPALNQTDGVEVNLGHRKVLAVDFHWEADWPPGPRDWDDHGHGTHVAGSAAGDMPTYGTHDRVDGMAPAARLVIQDGGALIDDCADLPGLGCPVKPLGPVLEQARDQGARLHTNSWGDEENFLPFGRYTERTADVDRFMWEHKDTLVFFAAGNSGPGDGTVISPATSKNVVAVGATLHGLYDPPCVVDFSSRGPTMDGRIKPDVVAPGTMIVSAATSFTVPGPTCGDATMSGTSMAAPTAAGLGALVRQYFVDGFHPSGRANAADAFEPTAALVKAVLIASAVDLSTRGCDHEPIPSREQGWGFIQLDTALAFEGDDRAPVVDDHREGFTSPDDPPVRVDIAVTDGGPLKVVLVWTDAPSSSLATTNLVNDLDLTVDGSNGAYPGNSFSGGVSVPGGDPDRLNNVEVVYLPQAERGLWSIEVAPHIIGAPAQDFALVVVGKVGRIESPRRPGGRVTPF